MRVTVHTKILNKKMVLIISTAFGLKENQIESTGCPPLFKKFNFLSVN